MAKKNTTAYDHPHFTVGREERMCAVQSPSSVTDFAHFRSRNKILLRAVHINMRSACSGTAGSLHFTRSAATIASKTISAASVGYSAVLTLTTNNTLHTISEVGAIRLSTGIDKGKFDVLWEYDILYPATHLGQ